MKLATVRSLKPAAKVSQDVAENGPQIQDESLSSTDLIPIFLQAAELQGLSLAPDIEKVVHQLRPELEGYAELEIRSDARRIDLITITERLEAVNTLLKIIKERGAAEEDLLLAQHLKRYGTGKTFGMKVPITGTQSGGELYIRGAMPIAAGAYLLERHIPGIEATGLLYDLAEIFGKSHTHMVAADVAPARSITFFLTTYLEAGKEAEDHALLHRALARIGIDQETISAYLTLHRALGSARPETLFFSWTASAVVSPPRVKIDYAGVRLGLVAELLSAVGADEQADKILAWGQRQNVSSANYAGLILSDKGFDQARAYFTIRS